MQTRMILIAVAFLALSWGAQAQAQACRSVDIRVTDMWCTDNCNHNPSFCPPTFCSCGSSDSSSNSTKADVKCKAVTPIATDYWCQATCTNTPPDCPPDFCKCTRNSVEWMPATMPPMMPPQSSSWSNMSSDMSSMNKTDMSSTNKTDMSSTNKTDMSSMNKTDMPSMNGTTSVPTSAPIGSSTNLTKLKKKKVW